MDSRFASLFVSRIIFVAPEVRAVLVLHEALGDHYREQQRWPDAMASYQRAFAATNPDATTWAARLLKLANVVAAADRGAELGALIRAHAARFAKDPADPVVSDDQRAVFQALAERVRAAGGGH